MKTPKKSNIHTQLSTVPSRVSFVFGIGVALGVVAAAGCIILLAVLLAQKPLFSGGDDNTNNTNAAAAVEQTTKINLGAIRHEKGAGEYTLVEYTDLECPFCKKFHPVIEKVMGDYSNRVRYAVKHFPLNIHPKARKEALAAECAGQQGKFFEYVNEIFAITPSNNQLEEEKLTDTAEKVGLDVETFESCLASESFAQEVADDALEAQATGATGTPHTLIVDSTGEIISGIRGSISEQQLRDELDRILQLSQ